MLRAGTCPPTPRLTSGAFRFPGFGLAVADRLKGMGIPVRPDPLPARRPPFGILVNDQRLDGGGHLQQGWAGLLQGNRITPASYNQTPIPANPPPEPDAVPLCCQSQGFFFGVPHGAENHPAVGGP